MKKDVKLVKKVILGRTGLNVTTVGLGCGGFSRLGLAKYGEAHSASIVRKAFDMGVNFFDTATAYGTEAAVGAGLTGIPRGDYVLSTKFPLFDDNWREGCVPRFTETLDASLRALRTDYVDIYHIHGVPPKDYEDVRAMLVPELMKAKDAGKIRFPGITERFTNDTSHNMVAMALADDIFDVMMIGFNLMNPSAAKTVFPKTTEKNVGVLGMFAVRRALADPPLMKADIQRILDHGQGGPGLEACEKALDFLMEPGPDGVPAASSIMDAAYRFCMHTPGIHVQLVGTGNPAHLEENLRSMTAPPLPPHILEKLESLFGNSDCVCGQEVPQDIMAEMFSKK